MDSTEALSRSCCRERRLKKPRAAFVKPRATFIKPRATFGIWKVKTHWTEHDVMTSEVVCQPIIRENRGFVLDNPIAKAGFVGPWTRSPWLDKGVILYFLNKDFDLWATSWLSRLAREVIMGGPASQKTAGDQSS